jgi:hypothetical protein
MRLARPVHFKEVCMKLHLPILSQHSENIDSDISTVAGGATRASPSMLLDLDISTVGVAAL